MKRVFLDSNVILDSILHREGYETVDQILQFGRNMYIKNCTSILSFANIAYILRKYRSDRDDLEKTMKALFDSIKILPMGDIQVYDALRAGGPPTKHAATSSFRATRNITGVYLFRCTPL